MNVSSDISTSFLRKGFESLDMRGGEERRVGSGSGSGSGCEVNEEGA